jgi:hypothetical protein
MTHPNPKSRQEIEKILRKKITCGYVEFEGQKGYSFERQIDQLLALQENYANMKVREVMIDLAKTMKCIEDMDLVMKKVNSLFKKYK